MVFLLRQKYLYCLFAGLEVYIPRKQTIGLKTRQLCPSRFSLDDGGCVVRIPKHLLVGRMSSTVVWVFPFR